MLNSGAPGVMLDLEDSMANTWEHLMLGHRNIVAALYGELTYEDAKRGGTVAHRAERHRRVEPRARTASLAGRRISQHEPTSASLFDLALIVFRLDYERLRHPLCIYIPKSESAEEALWWSDVFDALDRGEGLGPRLDQGDGAGRVASDRLRDRRVPVQPARVHSRASTWAAGITWRA